MHRVCSKCGREISFDAGGVSASDSCPACRERWARERPTNELAAEAEQSPADRNASLRLAESLFAVLEVYRSSWAIPESVLPASVEELGSSLWEWADSKIRESPDDFEGELLRAAGAFVELSFFVSNDDATLVEAYRRSLSRETPPLDGRQRRKAERVLRSISENCDLAKADWWTDSRVAGLKTGFSYKALPMSDGRGSALARGYGLYRLYTLGAVLVILFLLYFVAMGYGAYRAALFVLEHSGIDSRYALPSGILFGSLLFVLILNGIHNAARARSSREMRPFR